MALPGRPRKKKNDHIANSGKKIVELPDDNAILKTDRRDKIGRPRKELNDDQLDQVARCIEAHCTMAETAAIMGMSADTLERRLVEKGTNWTDFSAEHMAAGRASLRRILWAMAPHDFKAAKWLSIQHLGMKDKSELGFDQNAPVKFVLNMGKKLNQGENDE